jgi:hypothetical protein
MRCAFLPNFAFHRVGDSSTVDPSQFYNANLKGAALR